MQYLRITKEQFEDIKELSLKINQLKINEGLETMKHTEIARYLLNKSIALEKENIAKNVKIEKVES